MNTLRCWVFTVPFSSSSSSSQNSARENASFSRSNSSFRVSNSSPLRELRIDFTWIDIIFKRKKVWEYEKKENHSQMDLKGHRLNQNQNYMLTSQHKLLLDNLNTTGCSLKKGRICTSKNNTPRNVWKLLVLNKLRLEIRGEMKVLNQLKVNR